MNLKLICLHFKNRETILNKLNIEAMQSQAKMSTFKKLKVPPNILIATDDPNEFEKLKGFLRYLVGNNSYTIYRHDTQHIKNSSLWMSNCILLIESQSSKLKDDITDSCLSYLKHGGTILSIPALNQEDAKTSEHFWREIFNFEEIYANNFFFQKKQIIHEQDKDHLAELVYSYVSENYAGVHYVSKVTLRFTWTSFGFFYFKCYNLRLGLVYSLNKTIGLFLK